MLIRKITAPRTMATVVPVPSAAFFVACQQNVISLVKSYINTTSDSPSNNIPLNKLFLDHSNMLKLY